MPLFFIPEDDINEDTAYIRGDDARHIARSLRMAEGDPVDVSANDGYILKCSLTKIRDELCTLTVNERIKSLRESPVAIDLYMAYPKSDKLETIIQKSAELGVRKIIPFESSRCIKRPSSDGAEKRLLRLNRIAKEACGQCGRATLATVEGTLPYSKVLERAKAYELVLFCYEGEGTESLKSLLEGLTSRDTKSIALIVGSEGGFSKEEAEAARAAGFSMTGLGKRILRCETAPLYALSSLSYFFEL